MQSNAVTVSTSIDSKVAETCPVCGSHDVFEMHAAECERLEDVSFSYTFSPQNSRTFRVVRCRDCTHAYCSPIPGAVVGNYEEVVDLEYLTHKKSRELAAGAVLKSIARHAPSGALLDVGCATGDFLEVALQRGYRAEGLELSKWSCDIARSRGFTVHKERLDALARKSPGTYDVITLNGVIEHFSEPMTEMAHIATLLKPGGLVSLWTGDVDALPSRILGRKWWYWQGQHIQYFSHESLKLLAQKTGFAHVTTERYPFAATKETISNSLRRYPRVRPLLLKALSPVFALKPALLLRIPGEMLFMARRTS